MLASYASSELQLWIAEEMIHSNDKIPVESYDSYLINSFHELKDEYFNMGFPDLSLFITNEDFNGLEQAIRELDNRLQDIYKQKDLKLPIVTSKSELEAFFSEKIFNNLK